MASPHHDTEQTPLLHAEESSGPDLKKSPHNPRTVVLLLCSIIFIVTLGSGLTAIPSIRILEDIICHRVLGGSEGQTQYSLAGDIDELKCKTDEIQSELATIMGVQSMLEAAPSIFLAIPYGLLGDKIGRRIVLMLSMVGMTIAFLWLTMIMWFSDIFPPRYIWTSAVWLLIGGGNTVMVSMMYSIISDVETDEGRTNAFFYAIVANLGSDILATPISAKAMVLSPWIPLSVGVLLIVTGAALVLLLPETLPKKPPTPEVPVEEQTLLERMKAHLWHSLQEVKESTSILQSSSVVLLLFMCLVHGLINRASSFVLQYMSKRFLWTISDVGLLYSARSLVNIILLLVILPSISKALVSGQLPFKVSPIRKDLILARVSGILLSIGALLIAGPSIPSFVTGLVLFTLGFGFPAFCRSLVTTLVDAQHTARLYALISVIDAFSSLSAGPIMASLFNTGIKMKGDWIGLPYFYVSIFCALAAAAVLYLRVDSSDDQAE